MTMTRTASLLHTLSKENNATFSSTLDWLKRLNKSFKSVRRNLSGIQSIQINVKGHPPVIVEGDEILDYLYLNPEIAEAYGTSPLEEFTIKYTSGQSYSQTNRGQHTSGSNVSVTLDIAFLLKNMFLCKF